jgi:hypothetical protein
MLRRHAVWVAALAVLVFLPVLRWGFVYDDDWTITQNVSLERPLGDLISSLASGRSLAERVPNATRASTVLSFWLDRKLFGASPVGYHLHSLLLYGLCCGFATIVAFELTRHRSVALVAGTFFAVAPLHVETVAAINYRNDLYAGLGVLVGLACLYAARRRKRRKQSSPWREPDGLGRAIPAALVVGIGLFAKEAAAALFLLLALTLLDERLRRLARRRPRMLATVGAVVAVWAFWRFPLLFKGDDLPLAPARGGWQRLLRFARFEVESLRHAFLPWDYNPDRFRQPDASVAWLLTFALIVLGVVVLLRVRATRIPALGAAIALVAPLPSSPLVGPINEFADRYFFLGILGGGIFWGWCAVRLHAYLAGGPLGRVFALMRKSPLGLGILCAPLLIPTFRATGLWRDNYTLWTAATAMSPHSARAFLNLSREQRKTGEHAAARANLEHAIVLVPNYAPALLARVYDDIVVDADMAAARKHVDEILALGLGKARGVSRAVKCVKLDDPAEAKRCADR